MAVKVKPTHTGVMPFANKMKASLQRERGEMIRLHYKPTTVHLCQVKPSISYVKRQIVSEKYNFLYQWDGCEIQDKFQVMIYFLACNSGNALTLSQNERNWKAMFATPGAILAQDLCLDARLN